MRLKVISTSSTKGDLPFPVTKVVNAETGEPLTSVLSVSFEHDATRNNNIPMLVVKIYDFDVDVEAEGAVVKVTREAGKREMQ